MTKIKITETQTNQEPIADVVGTMDNIIVDDLAVENNIDIQINEKLTIHVFHSADGYIVDLYKYVSPEDEDEEHDYDADFIDSICVGNDQLEPEDL
jgi:hypothetical protein